MLEIFNLIKDISKERGWRIKNAKCNLLHHGLVGEFYYIRFHPEMLNNYAELRSKFYSDYLILNFLKEIILEKMNKLSFEKFDQKIYLLISATGFIGEKEIDKLPKVLLTPFP